MCAGRNQVNCFFLLFAVSIASPAECDTPGCDGAVINCYIYHTDSLKQRDNQNYYQ